MSEDYRVSATASAKIVLHAAKYTTGEVCGVLIGNADDSATQPVVIDDAVPLFHKRESVASPLLDVALAQVESYASSRGSKIVGVYQANERGDDKELHYSAKRIADVVREQSTPQACILLVDNARFASFVNKESHGDAAGALPFHLFVRRGGQWSAESPKHLKHDAPTRDIILEHLAKRSQANLADFSDHTDNIDRNYLNNDFLSR